MKIIVGQIWVDDQGLTVVVSRLFAACDNEFVEYIAANGLTVILGKVRFLSLFIHSSQQKV
jgi:hypothetical protein